MKNNRLLINSRLIILPIIVLAACGFNPPTAVVETSQPTLTSLPFTATATASPPTNTPYPSPSATPFPVPINAGNIQAVGVRQELSIPEDSVRAVAFRPTAKSWQPGQGRTNPAPIKRFASGILIPARKSRNRSSCIPSSGMSPLQLTAS